MLLQQSDSDGSFCGRSVIYQDTKHEIHMYRLECHDYFPTRTTDQGIYFHIPCRGCVCQKLPVILICPVFSDNFRDIYI